MLAEDELADLLEPLALLGRFPRRELHDGAHQVEILGWPGLGDHFWVSA